MSDPVLSAEEVATYEPLEFTDLHREATASTGSPSSYVRRKNTLTPDIVLPTAAELTEIQNQAREEGYAAAYSEGSRRMSSLLNAMNEGIRQAEQDVAQDLLNLALEAAKQMVKQTLASKPEVVLNIIREAIAALPHVSSGAHLVVNPADAEIIRQHMGEQLAHAGWKIFEDAAITRGGARVETANSQIDASVETRWKRIVSGLGQDNNWVQE